MNILLLVLVFIIVLWAIILLLDRYFDLESYGMSVSPGALIWRTKHGLGLLDRIASSSKKLWKIFGIAGAVLCGILMPLIFLNLADKAKNIIISMIAPPAAGGGGVPAIMPLIPGWTIPIGLIIPFLIGIATVLIVHEPAHGITARRVGLPVESTGLLLFLVIPGAFVEPDEDKLKNAPVLDRIQVYGAGSFANIFFGFLCFGLILALIVPLPGLYVGGVFENTPASEELQAGMRLMEIGYEGGSLVEISNYQAFENFMDTTKPKDNIVLITDDEIFTISLENHPNENTGYIGIYTIKSSPRSKLLLTQFAPIFIFWETQSLEASNVNQLLNLQMLQFGKEYTYEFLAPGFLIKTLFWMALLNIGIGLFNLLPLKPLDGGHIAESLSEKVSSKKTAKYVALALSVITLSVVMINLMVWIV